MYICTYIFLNLGMVEAGGRSLTGTPTWAVATVITVMVTLGFFFQASLQQFGKVYSVCVCVLLCMYNFVIFNFNLHLFCEYQWLDKTKRKALVAALDKIKDGNEQNWFTNNVLFVIMALQKGFCFLSYLVVIEPELMLFGLLSLLMGHWIIYVAKICVKSSAFSRRFYPCALESELSTSINHVFVTSPNFMNYSTSRRLLNDDMDDYCPQVMNFYVSSQFFTCALQVVTQFPAY